MTAAEWEAWCDATVPEDEPPVLGDEDEEPDLDAEPGEWAGGASGFAAGEVLDALAGGRTLAFYAEGAAGEDGRYAGASDNELDGVISARDRAEAYACARKHAAVAEFIRRRAEPDCGIDELPMLPAEHRGTAEDLMCGSQLVPGGTR